MAANDVYQCTVVSAVNGQRCVNTIHLRETTVCTDDIPARSVGAAFEDVLMPLLLACLCPEALIQCIYTRRVLPTAHIPFLIVQSNAPGVLGTESVPSNAAAVISLYTTAIGRSGRGRQYISGVPEDYVANGILETPLVGALEAYAQGLVDAVAAPAPYDGVWTGCVFSPTLNESNDIIFFNVSPSMGSMESRRQPYAMIP